MDVGLRTPLLDFFRRGDVARDVKLLAAQGAVAPRPLEQLGLLVLLAADSDDQIRTTAEATIARIPAPSLAAFIARADVPADLRDFFVARGLEPAAIPAPDDDAPLVDTDDTDSGSGDGEDAGATARRVARMTVLEKVKAAIKGTREIRQLLVRDSNRMVVAAVLSCPKLSDQEVETFAKMPNVSEDVLRTIGNTRSWTKHYSIVLGLAKNPKTPLAMSLAFLHRLTDRDVRALSIDRNVPDPLRIAARKKVVLG
jgi:hypothetical protein